jgi:prevent-host-death family protein
MRTVGVRELRQNASELLDHVESGDTIEITNHGRAVARLVPISHGEGLSYRELVARGLLRPGRGDILEVAPVRQEVGAPSTAELLALDRDDNR